MERKEEYNKDVQIYHPVIPTLLGGRWALERLDHTASKRQNQNWNPGLSDSKPSALSLYYVALRGDVCELQSTEMLLAILMVVL